MLTTILTVSFFSIITFICAFLAGYYAEEFVNKIADCGDKFVFWIKRKKQKESHND